jgi:Tfp pilus assembly protein PilF
MLRLMQPAIAMDLQRAFGLMQSGQLDQAAEICQRLQAKAPAEPDVLHLFGLIRKQQGRHDEAEKLLRSSIRHAPGRANFHANLGNLLANMGRYEDAASVYRDALGIDGSFRPARLGLARALNSAGDHVGAEHEAGRLVEADRRDAEAFVALGVALAGQGRNDEAEAAYRTALDVTPGYGAALHNLGALLGREGRVEESLQYLDAAAETGVRGVEIDFNRASGLLKLYQFEEGEALLSSVVQSSPAYAEAQKLLAQFRYMRGSGDYARELQRAVARFPRDAKLQIALGQVLHGAHELEAAEAALKSSLQYCDENPRLLAMLATICQESGRFEQALEYAREAIGLDPGDARLADFEIDALMSLGDAQAALPLIEAARKRSPGNQWYIAIQATAARLLGDPLYESLCNYEEFVRTYDLEAPEPWQSMETFHADLVSALHRRHQFEAHPLDQSLRLGTQTPRNLINDPDPVIQAFISALAAPIDAYRDAIGYDPDHPLKMRNRGSSMITGCWSVRLKRGGFHVNHVHPDGWISSAYYAEVPQEVDDEEARSGWIKFGEPRYPVPGVTPEKMVMPKAGRLVLFPSYLWHGTTPIRGDEPRMTLAFDVVTRPDPGPN